MLAKLILVFLTAQTTAFNHCTWSGFSAHIVFDSTLTMSKFQPSPKLAISDYLPPTDLYNSLARAAVKVPKTRYITPCLMLSSLTQNN